jgi:ABC-type multidrug transport system ATPase subunit
MQETVGKDNDSMITTVNLSKTYAGRDVPALQGVSLEVHPGELFGLIGPDGAGKTTLLRILATLLLPGGGSARVGGRDVVKHWREIRMHTGYMPGRFSLYQDLSVEENLAFFATLFRTTLKDNYDLIRDIYAPLEPFKKRRAGKLSGGMKQKLALCCALIHRPEVLLLDEPTTGVDPVSRLECWETLGRLRQQGLAILVSTPYMDEASRCSRIAFMRGGSCLATGTPHAICRSYPRPLYAVRSEQMYRLLGDLRRWPGTHSCHAFGHSHHLSLKHHAPPLAHLEAYLGEKGYTDLSIRPAEPSLEDCFIEPAND